METFATLKYVSFSAQKGRVVADQVRGLPVGNALNILAFSSKRAARVIKKVLESAVANAENNLGADVDELHVSTIFVNEGPSLPRHRFRAKGRSDRILRRMCHVTVKVSDKKKEGKR